MDSSEAALALARANAQRNGVADRCQFVRADVAEFMRAAAPQTWDIVVLDPPKLAPSRKVPPASSLVNHPYMHGVDVVETNQTYPSQSISELSTEHAYR